MYKYIILFYNRYKVLEKIKLFHVNKLVWYIQAKYNDY